MTRRPHCTVVGFIAKLPIAGMALYNLHYIAGLMELGYDVHYVERQNYPGECYDPNRNESGNDPTYGLQWLQTCLALLPRPVSWTFIDLKGGIVGTRPSTHRRRVAGSRFALTLADATWFDGLEDCPRRAFVDGDPLFTQVEMLDSGSRTASTLTRYPTLFTYWTRPVAPDTTVPTAGRRWIPTTPVVSTALWEAVPLRPDAPVTTVMNWAAWHDVVFRGVSYGHKNRSMEDFIELPTRVDRPMTLAVGGPAPKDRLLRHGWRLVDPLAATGTIEAYRSFIGASFADLGICKHAYVASRSGWFSDRSLCYLASGRPVLHQDTGFGDWLPVGEGVIPFSDTDSVVRGLEELERDYPSHARAARRLAEQFFEARVVLGRMLDEAEFR